MLDKQMKKDYKNCLKQIKFWKRIQNDKRYEDIFSWSEIQEIINYYEDMKRFLDKDVEIYDTI